MIPGVVDTCRECRASASPKPDATPEVELTIAQNVNVESDIMYYKVAKSMNLLMCATAFMHQVWWKIAK